MSIFDRFRRTGKVEEEAVEKQETVEEVREKPRGSIVSTTDASRSALAALLTGATTEHTDAELRTAATLPLIAGIIRTIVTEVESYSLVVREKDPSDDDTPKKMLEQTLLFPNEVDRTARVALEGAMRDWLILGRSAFQLLRALPGHRVALAFLNGKIDENVFEMFLRQYASGELNRTQLSKLNNTELMKALGTPGPILGYVCHAPEYIVPNVTKSGVYKNPAFYDISEYGEYAKYLTDAQKRKLKSYQKYQMALIQYTGETEPDYRLRSRSPTNDAYILIDIMFAMLVLLRDKLNRPQMDKLISFAIPKDAKQLTPGAMDNIVAALREDLGYGRLPVLQGVIARVNEIGMGDSFEVLWGIIRDIKVFAWQIFGVGGVQMLEMEGQGRQAATQQIEAAKKQAVGKMLRVLEEDLFHATIINDAYSPYNGLATEWVDKSKVPTREDRMEKFWTPLMRYGGLPAAPILKLDFPEVIAQLEADGIDPTELRSPEIMSAMLRAGLIEPEVPEGEGEAEEETEEETEMEEEE